MRALARAFFDVTNPTEVGVEPRLDATPAPDRLRRHGPPLGVTLRTAGGIVRCAAPGESPPTGIRATRQRVSSPSGLGLGGGRHRSTEDLEGEQSPWEERAHRVGNGAVATTDSSVEKGLGAGCSPTDRRCVGSMWGFASANRSTDPGGNGRKATAAVMRHGCWRGEPCEGSPRRGNGREAGNTTNPKAASGAQQTRWPRCGGSRRGGENPRGRNRSRDWTSRPEGGRVASAGRPTGSGRIGEHGEGVEAGKTTRGGTRLRTSVRRRDVSAESRALWR